MFKPFYVHIHRQPGRMSPSYSRGFTVKVSPDRVEPHTMCSLQVAFCSQKDQFNKKIGRETAETKEPVIVSKRMLPHHLTQLADKVGGKGWYTESEFQYLYKYVL
jgi:hypothetical protein